MVVEAGTFFVSFELREIPIFAIGLRENRIKSASVAKQARANNY